MTETRADTVAIVLAAGRGTRMRSSLPKSLVPLRGKALVSWELDALEAAGVGRRVVVVGPEADALRAVLPAGVQTALQEVPDGTASAVACAEAAVGEAAHVLVLVGDSPLLSARSLRALVAHHIGSGAACSFLTAEFPAEALPPYARVLRGDGGVVLGCVEERDCDADQLGIRELLTSHFIFDAAALWAVLPLVSPHGVTGERYLTDVIELLGLAGRRVAAVRIDDWRELVGLNTPEELAWAEGVLDELTHRGATDDQAG